MELDGTHIMVLKAGKDGSFRLDVRIGEKGGRREISVVAVDLMGNVSPPASITVIRESLLPTSS